MHKHSRLLPILACAATLAVAGCATGTGIAPTVSAPMQLQQLGIGPGWIHAGNVVYHVPHYMPTRAMARPNVSGILFTYYGGPVLPAPKAYLILWGYQKYGDPDGVGPLLQSFLGVIGGSAHDNIYDQYYEGSGSSKTFITNPSGQLAGVWDDETDPVPAHPTDAQVASESLQGVAHFGYDPNGSYIVATPHGRSISGFGSQFCAYHSSTTSGGSLVSYTNLPYMPDAGSNCGAGIITPPSDETSADEGVTQAEGHEYGESITDPNPGLGWYNYTYGEIGDPCAYVNVKNDKFGTKHYTTQPMYSNAAKKCVHTAK